MRKKPYTPRELFYKGFVKELSSMVEPKQEEELDINLRRHFNIMTGKPKIAYKSIRAASASDIFQSDPNKYKVYLCDLCGFYHIGATDGNHKHER